MGEGSVPPPWHTACFPAPPHIDSKHVKSSLQPALGGGGESVSKVSSCNKIGGGNTQTGLVLEVGSKHCLQEWPLVKQP